MNETNSTEKRRRKPRKSRLKRFLSTIGAGVIGSVLTLTIVSNASFMQNNQDSTKDEAPITQAEGENAYTVQQTSVTTVSLADMVENASKAIVGIVNYKNQMSPLSPASENVQSGSGSGVIFKKEGEFAYIVTNNHVIEGAEKIEVSLGNGEKTTAELVGADALSDFAVLKIDAKYADDDS